MFLRLLMSCCLENLHECFLQYYSEIYPGSQIGYIYILFLFFLVLHQMERLTEMQPS